MYKKHNNVEKKTRKKEVVICNKCIKSSDDGDLTVYDFSIVDKGSYHTIYCNNCAETTDIIIVKPYKIKKNKK